MLQMTSGVLDRAIICIREAQDSDYPEITEVSIRVWRHAYQGIIDQSFLDNISFEQRLKNRVQLSEPGRYSLIAAYHNKIIGFCDFGISRHPHYAKGEIYAIYVLPEYQRIGVGYLLLQQAINRLTQEHLMPCIVIALEQNLSAQQFYEGMGFIFIDKIDANIGNKEYLEKVYISQ